MRDLVSGTRLDRANLSTRARPSGGRLAQLTRPATGTARWKHVTARSRTSSPPVSTGSRSRREPVMPMSADLEPLWASGSGRRGPRERAARRLLDANPIDPDCGAPCGARRQQRKTPDKTGVLKYCYRDSNPGFRREREIEGSTQRDPMLPAGHPYRCASASALSGLEWGETAQRESESGDPVEQPRRCA